MRILIVSQYFWPENFRINDIVEFFTSRGHNVDILTGYPNYPGGRIFENYKKILIILKLILVLKLLEYQYV